MGDWRSSGLTSAAYCEDKPYTPGCLRHWAHLLGQVRPRKRAKIRLARVLRVAAPIESGRQSIVAGGPATPGTKLVVEVGQARVAVHPGFDRATLAALLDVLTGSAGEL